MEEVVCNLVVFCYNDIRLYTPLYKKIKERKEMKITIAGTGYVGLSNAVLLAQHNEEIALDIIQEKVNLINHKNLRLWMRRLNNI